MTDVIRIATRRSRLALWQAEHVRDRLRALHPGIDVTLVPMQTQGDKLLEAPLAKVGGKGLFIKALESALLRGDADVAVHSMKDVTVDLPEGLVLSVIMAREDPRDALVSLRFPNLDALPRGACVGTSSLRRACQLRGLRPDVRIVNLRGNVNTRLRKLESGEFDAIILACAGLKRLGLADRIVEAFDVERFLPAVGQGAMGIECRSHDPRTQALIAPLYDPTGAVCVLAERAMNRRLGGGCQVPIAGYAESWQGGLRLRALVSRLDASEIIRSEASTITPEYEKLGETVAAQLLAQGAGEVLREAYASG